jgi:Mn2+/Fe2+ NRAMP family transporter
MITVRRLVPLALILLLLALIMTLISIFYEGFSLIKLWGLLIVIAGVITVYFYMLPASKVVRATFVIQPDGIEDRVAQAMATIGFTIEPHSQFGNSFTFRATGTRLVVTKTTSGIEVAGPSGCIDNLASKLGVIPHKKA